MPRTTNPRCPKCGGLPRPAPDAEGFIRCKDCGKAIKRRRGRPNELGETTSFEIRLTVDDYLALSKTAKREGVSLAECSREAVHQWLERKERAQGKAS